jgi:hypothetical protein
VDTFSDRSSIRITVSEPETFPRLIEATRWLPKARVTVTLTPDVPVPGPRPHPPAIAAVNTTAIATDGMCGVSLKAA